MPESERIPGVTSDLGQVRVKGWSKGFCFSLHAAGRAGTGACPKIGPWDSPRQSASYSRPSRLGSYHAQHGGTGQVQDHSNPWEPGRAVVVGAGHGNGE